MNLFLAIDPGASGGMAWNDITGTRTNCIGMPDNYQSIAALLKLKTWNKPIVIMEQVSGFIGKAQPGSAMFSFGENYGFLKGVIQTLDLRLILVTPQRWQKALELGRKKDYDYPSKITKGKRKGESITRNAWKEHLIQEAERLYPKLYPTPQTADAILILHYAINFL